MRGETCFGSSCFSSSENFNPLPSCEGRLHNFYSPSKISNFNPLPSCEGRQSGGVGVDDKLRFQSTPLMRGETLLTQKIPCEVVHFNPLPSCEGRRGGGRGASPRETISIHSPHARGDRIPTWARQPQKRFQSTPLMRGETIFRIAARQRHGISIHSPHARGDLDTLREAGLIETISIHSPHARGDVGAAGEGERPDAFQSTPLMRGETHTAFFQAVSSSISIHSPHTRGDAMRPPAQSPQAISIHSPHARGDRARAPMPLSWP